MGNTYRYVALNYKYLHEFDIIAWEALVYQDSSDIEKGTKVNRWTVFNTVPESNTGFCADGRPTKREDMEEEILFRDTV
jgi:hypothetical protein